MLKSNKQTGPERLNMRSCTNFHKRLTINKESSTYTLRL